jgi:cardiolipin synthase A/B
MQYLEMIEMAKKTVYIHTPYLIPNDSLIDSLRIAAASGVDVRIIIPDKPDHMFVYWNNISSANTLMESGVRVYMYNRGFVHSKTVVSDGQYCSVGSANFDDRSLVLNFETNMMIYSEEIGKQMVAAFEDDLKYCTEYSCEEYAKRTLMMKFRIGVSKLFRTVA